MRALRPTDLTIDQGSHVAVIGPSGSGKSTLLNILGLLDVPDGGEYTLSGYVTTELRDSQRAALRAAHIGFVFQQFHLLPAQSVVHNVGLGLLYARGNRRERVGSIGRALERVGLSHRRNAFASTLSGGEAQRVAIARAIVRSPRLLLADEPTGNLDSRSSEAVLDVLDLLREELNLTVVVVTHNTSVADRAERVVEVVDGMVRG